MKELLNYVSDLIVNDRDKLQITEREDAAMKKYTIRVAKADTKNIIGREGMTIKAIRSLVSMAAINNGLKKKIPIEIVDDECV